MKGFIIALFFLALPAAAQCHINRKDSPLIRGLRLGMTPIEIEKVIPKSSGIDTSAVVNYLTPVRLAKLKGFEDLHGLDITVIGGEIDSLAFKYSPSIQWASVYEFVDAVSRPLNLPRNSFVFDDGTAQLLCEGFTVSIRENYILLKSTRIKDQLTELNEQNKKAFKP